ncbi:PEP-CTERM sorting domain-containing protein [Gloeothece verrucosa]|uniref:Ice-binding protein C-terminal domain-containing protein n=1 Tax=Gloeothece verrucosa (strain PCC 7822) TaxID=497965 RepID=E0U5P2_GLOV7|nr:PEP-CTERM sorting domain-containing protein [Gloeothece verrucosa]ADN14755.1 protein of unknown function DUF1555 [Gloeothece verrucosa PCC 7822]
MLKFKYKLLTGIILTATFFCLAGVAEAVTFTFPSSLKGKKTAIFSQEGLSLTLSNATSDNNNLIDADVDGLLFDNPYNSMSALKIKFSESVTITSYTISYSNGQFAKGGQSLSIGSVPHLSTGLGTHDTDIFVNTNTFISLFESSGIMDVQGAFNISKITVTPTPVPEPSIILGLLSLSSVGFLGKRKG